MDQDEVVESIAKNLDLLAELIKWTLLVAVVLWWAGFERQDLVDIAGMKISHGRALWVGVVLYIAANFMALILLLRLGDLLLLVEDSHISRAVTKAALHPWPLNPFACFGSDVTMRLHSSVGVGFLIVTWWVCNSSLYLHAEQVQSPLAVTLEGLFLGLGLGSIFAIDRVYTIMLTRVEYVDSSLYQTLHAIRLERTISMLAGTTIGGIVACVTQLVRFG